MRIIVFLFLVAVGSTISLAADLKAEHHCTAEQVALDNQEAIDESNWDLRKSENGIHIYTRGNIATEALLFKTVSVFPPSAYDGLYDLLWTHNLERQLDYSKTFITGRTAAKYDNDTDVHYIQNGAIWPVSNRDFCYVRCRNDIPRGVHVVVRSIEDESICPHVSGIVRGFMSDCAYRLERQEDGTAKVTYLLQVDIKGYLPFYVSNMANVKVMFNEFTEMHKLYGPSP